LSFRRRSGEDRRRNLHFASHLKSQISNFKSF
jgi:hypothetical protein